jgi:hypothetical protein
MPGSRWWSGEAFASEKALRQVARYLSEPGCEPLDCLTGEF